MNNVQNLLKRLIQAEELTAMLRKDFLRQAKKETKNILSEDLFGDHLFDD